jgi:hypothetical protein
VAIVVSDTSPILALLHLNLERLFPDLYGEVLLPPAVLHELAAMTDLEPRIAGWSRIVPPRDAMLVARFRARLHYGESEVLALAMQVNADLVIMDDWDARVEAKRLGLTTTGALGVLLHARRVGMITAIRPLIDQLRAGLDFRMSEQLRRDVLRLADESD